MRTEIVQAFDRSKYLAELLAMWRRDHPIVEGSSPPMPDYFPPAGHPYTVERDRNLAHTYQYLNSLQQCLIQSPANWAVHVGTATSLEIQLNEMVKDTIVIELSVYGPLAAVFMYGVVQPHVQESVEACIQKCGLTQLTPDEIAALESSNTYQELF